MRCYETILALYEEVEGHKRHYQKDRPSLEPVCRRAADRRVVWRRACCMAHDHASCSTQKACKLLASLIPKAIYYHDLIPTTRNARIKLRLMLLNAFMYLFPRVASEVGPIKFQAYCPSLFLSPRETLSARARRRLRLLTHGPQPSPALSRSSHHRSPVQLLVKPALPALCRPCAAL